MIDIISIINDLGPDADLLLESDRYLENERSRLATELEKTSLEFCAVLRAIMFKRRMQQSNQVAVRLIERDQLGTAEDISIKIMPLPDALAILKQQRTDATDASNEAEQRSTWQLDGYDIQIADALRAS